MRRAALLTRYAALACRPSRPCPLQLSVFVRDAQQKGPYAEVTVPRRASVAALQKAAVLELQLGAPPHRVLLKLDEGSAAGQPLDSTQKLASTEVKDGAKLIVEVLPAGSECTA